MKNAFILKISIVFSVLIIVQNTCFSQVSVGTSSANKQFSQGLKYFSNKNYTAALNAFLECERTVPNKPLTYYMIASTYAMKRDKRNTLFYINKALSQLKPTSKYYLIATNLRDWASREQNNPPPVTTEERVVNIGEAVEQGPVVKIPEYSENPYTLQTNSDRKNEVPIIQVPSEGKVSGQEFTFPGGGTMNNKSTIGDFCCYGETATVLNNENRPIGYIYFYSFDGAYNIGNGKSVASKFEILVSGSPSLHDQTQERIEDKVEFAANELFPGAVKIKTVGTIKYTITILDVIMDTSGKYLLGSVKAKVVASF